MPLLLSSFQTAKTTLDWLQCAVKGLPTSIVLQIFSKLQSGAFTILSVSGSCDIGQADAVMHGYQNFCVVFTWWSFSFLGGVLQFMGYIASMALGQVL